MVSLDFPAIGVHGLKVKFVTFFNVKIHSPFPYLPVTGGCLGLAFEVGLITNRGQGRKGKLEFFGNLFGNNNYALCNYVQY